MGGTYNEKFVEEFPQQFMGDIRRIITDHPLRNDFYEGDLLNRVWMALDQYVTVERPKLSSTWMYGNTQIEGHRLSDLHALCAGILIGANFPYLFNDDNDENLANAMSKCLISIEYSWF
jgi:hypothetical protein